MYNIAREFKDNIRQINIINKSFEIVKTLKFNEFECRFTRSSNPEYELINSETQLHQDYDMCYNNLDLIINNVKISILQSYGDHEEMRLNNEGYTKIDRELLLIGSENNICFIDNKVYMSSKVNEVLSLYELGEYDVEHYNNKLHTSGSKRPFNIQVLTKDNKVYIQVRCELLLDNIQMFETNFEISFETINKVINKLHGELGFYDSIFSGLDINPMIEYDKTVLKSYYSPTDEIYLNCILFIQNNYDYKDKQWTKYLTHKNMIIFHGDLLNFMLEIVIDNDVIVQEHVYTLSEVNTILSSFNLETLQS